ncbi:MAG: peptidylprolyl isomerase [Fluviicola sp.]|nr:MAG: peptidylprolyl isomerase [Fluviicola sp.]
MKRKIFLLTCLVLVFTSACNKKLSPEEQMEKDQEIITNYIDDNNLDAEKTSSGLHYVITDLGTGNYPNSNSDVTVRYKGYFTDGSVFDESDSEGITFNLQQVIEGWTEGIPKLKEGGEGVLLIPSALAYGPDGNSSIPPNSVLIFDVALLDIPG